MHVFRLDPFKLGEVLMLLGAISANLGHAGPVETVGSYWNRDHLQSLEQQFVYDLLMETREVIVARWYGSEVEAGSMAVENYHMAIGI